jgi:hypothetical protein
MHYHQNAAWREEIDRTLKAYRRNTVNVYPESAKQDDILQENHPSKMLLYKVEEKIRDAKHVIRRCRHERVWIPTLLQEPAQQEGDLPINLHSLDMHHRYEKALQKYKRQLDQYEQLKAELQEKVYAEEEQ